MKKALLILIITISLFSKLSAQQYYPMLDSVNRWIYGIGECGALPHLKHISTSSCGYPNVSACDNGEIYTGKDTLIDTLTYKTVFAGDHNTSSYCLYGFMREDTSLKKVYFKDTIITSEILLYDFSMQIEDSINLQFFNLGGYYMNGWYQLDSIVNINIPVGTRKVFYLNCHSCSNSHILPWIESIGFPGDVIYPYSINQNGGCGCYSILPYFDNSGDNFYQMLNCFEHNTKVYYDSSFLFFGDSCYYCRGCPGGIPELTSLSSLDVSPNPSNGKINISLSISKPDNFEIYIRDITGKQILNKFSLGRLNKGNTNRELDVSNLISGFYLLECKGNEGSSFRKLIIQK